MPEGSAIIAHCQEARNGNLQFFARIFRSNRPALICRVDTVISAVLRYRFPYRSCPAIRYIGATHIARSYQAGALRLIPSITEPHAPSLRSVLAAFRINALALKAQSLLERFFSLALVAFVLQTGRGGVCCSEAGGGCCCGGKPTSRVLCSFLLQRNIAILLYHAPRGTPGGGVRQSK